MTSISFIIPTYNNSHLIERCISSIQKQIDTADKIIVVDDGSSDGSYETLQKNYAKVSNIVILNQKNSGSGSARNKGIDYAQTEYLWFVDSDDYIEKGAVRELKEIIKMNSYDMIFFDYYQFTDKNKEKVSLDIDPEDKLELMTTDHVPWNKLINRSLFEVIRFPEDKIRFQDHGTIPAVISKATSIKYINQAYYNYDFSHENNITKRTSKNDDMFKAFNYLVDYFIRGIIKPDEFEVLIYKTFLYNHLYRSLSTNFSDIYSNIVKIDNYLNKAYPHWSNSSFFKYKYSKTLFKNIKGSKIKGLVNKVFDKSKLMTAILIYLIRKIERK